jgi:hypothetical protein
MVVVTAVFCVLLAGLITMSVNAATEYAFGSTKLAADNSASLALQALARNVRDGVRASVDTTGTQLTVVFPAVNAQGDYDRFTDGATCRYYLTGTTLYRQQGTATPSILGRNLASVRFSVNGSQVGLAMTSRQQSGPRSQQTVLSTQVTLRNEAIAP